MRSLKTVLLIAGLTLSGMANFGQVRHQLPAARWTAQITYDDHAKRVLLFGGSSKSGLLNDLWSWDGKMWKKLEDGHAPQRNKAVLVFDIKRNVAVLFGGNTPAGKNAGDTWEWDGTTWTEIKISGPEARVHAMGIYDEKNQQILIFGGFGAKGMLRDTWAYNGKNWRLIDENGPAALAHGIFYDHRNDRPVMITAEQKLEANPKYMRNQPWVWTGTSWKPTGWLEVKTSSESLQALAYDDHDIVLYDGDDVNEDKGKTWIFTNGQWSGSYLPGPGMRVGHAMIYDKEHKQILLFGGSNRKDYFNDTWTWDGQKWQSVSP